MAIQALQTLLVGRWEAKVLAEVWVDQKAVQKSDRRVDQMAEQMVVDPMESE